jgi:hypothetical protein
VIRQPTSPVAGRRMATVTGKAIGGVVVGEVKKP